MPKLLTVTLLGFVAVLIAPTSSSRAEAPTFARDVAPILYSNCVSCHRPSEVAPFTLAAYAIEGGPSTSYMHTKAFMYAQPQAWHRLCERLASTVADFLIADLSSMGRGGAKPRSANLRPAWRPDRGC